MEYNGLPLYNAILTIGDDGLDLISLVNSPAMKSTFIALSDQSVSDSVKIHLNEEKKIITGVAMRPNFPIYRKENGREFYMQFSADEIERAVYKFMREGRTMKVNIEHSQDQEEIDGIWMIESFILSENHRIGYPQFDDIEPGSWVVSYKVDNDDVWNDIKDGKLRGFSIQANGKLVMSEYYDIKEYNTLSNFIEISKFYENYRKIEQQINRHQV